MGQAVFYEVGLATRISSTAGSATAGIQPSTGSLQAAVLTNASTNDVYYSISKSSAAVAVAATTTPSSGNNLLLQRTQKQIMTPPNPWVSAITTAGQADLIFQPGNAGTLG